jgi:hypothetical protein
VVPPRLSGDLGERLRPVREAGRGRCHHPNADSRDFTPERLLLRDERERGFALNFPDSGRLRVEVQEHGSKHFRLFFLKEDHDDYCFCFGEPA